MWMVEDSQSQLKYSNNIMLKAQGKNPLSHTTWPNSHLNIESWHVINEACKFLSTTIYFFVYSTLKLIWGKVMITSYCMHHTLTAIVESPLLIKPLISSLFDPFWCQWHLESFSTLFCVVLVTIYCLSSIINSPSMQVIIKSIAHSALMLCKKLFTTAQINLAVGSTEERATAVLRVMLSMANYFINHLEGRVLSKTIRHL